MLFLPHPHHKNSWLLSAFFQLSLAYTSSSKTHLMAEISSTNHFDITLTPRILKDFWMIPIPHLAPVLSSTHTKILHDLYLCQIYHHTKLSIVPLLPICRAINSELLPSHLRIQLHLYWKRNSCIPSEYTLQPTQGPNSYFKHPCT